MIIAEIPTVNHEIPQIHQTQLYLRIYMPKNIIKITQNFSFSNDGYGKISCFIIFSEIKINNTQIEAITLIY